MNNHIEKLCDLAGNQHKYQYTLLLITLAIWINIDIIAISIPYLEKKPDIKYLDSKGKAILTQMNYKLCLDKNLKYNITSPITQSWVTEYNVYCDKVTAGLIGSACFLGAFIGSLLFQKIVSKFGRRNAIIMNMMGFSILLLVICFANDINAIIFLVFLIQLTPVTVCYGSYILCCENIAASKRSTFGAIINTGFCICGIFYIFIFKFVDNWRIVFIISSITTLICAVLVIKYVVESPRYLISHGKYKEFMKVLMEIASFNGKKEEFVKKLEEEHSEFKKSAEILENNYKLYILYKPSDVDPSKEYDKENVVLSDQEIVYNVIDNRKDECYIGKSDSTNECENEKLKEKQKIKLDFTENIDQREEHKKLNKKHSSIRNLYILLSYPSLRIKFLISSIFWFTVNSNYYGITIHIKNLPGDIYINGIIIYTLEIFSYLISGCIINLKFLGRKGGMSLYYLIIIFGYLLLLGLKSNNQILVLLLTFVIRFCVAGIFNILFTYSCEIYPTCLRADGFGFNSAFGKIAAVIIPILMEFFVEYVNLIFATMNVLSFVLLYLMPETLDLPLTDHIAENE